MLRLVICLGLLSTAILSAGNLPWIGVSLRCADSKLKVSSKLPEGVGLEVRQVSKGGPLEKVGGKEGDIWWKFDDQILVNRGQLVALLRGKKSGDQVDIEFFRMGVSQKSTVTLEKWPESRMKLISNRRNFEEREQRSRRLESSKQTASMSFNGEYLSLEKTSTGWGFVVKKDNKVLFDRELGNSEIGSSLEARWMEPFMILQMTLAQKSTSVPGAKKERVRYRKPESKESN